MAQNAQILRVLIASPGDVTRQRNVAESEVHDWNRGPTSKDRGIFLQPLRWEWDAVAELGTGDGQEVLNRQILDEADILIAIFHTRLGTATARAVSGTAEEIQGAVDRGIPVHVFMCRGPIPFEHDAEQLAAVKAFEINLRSAGLLQEFESDDELTRLVRRAVDADVAGHVHRHPTAGAPGTPTNTPSASTVEPTPVVALQDTLNKAADDLLGIGAIAPDVRVDGPPNWIATTHAERLEEITKASMPLIQAVARTVRSEHRELDVHLLELIPQLAPNPRRGGSTALLDLLRAPGVLLFHATGVAACAARHDTLTGKLLTNAVEVDDPYNGVYPAVASLRPDLLQPRGWPSQVLHDVLVPALSEPLGSRRVAEAAWARWTYLAAVVTTYQSSVLSGVYGGHPYLMVDGPHVEPLRVVAAAPIRREIRDQGASHPLLAAGMCDGSAELFDTAAQTFESNFGGWAERLDWQNLPPGGGMLPSGPHYPGVPVTG